MNKLILLFVSAVALRAQTAVINGATARFRVITGTSAASSTACDASNEVGGLYVRTGNQSSVPTSVSVCKQTGASSYAWGPIGWYAQTTAPATCVVGEIWFDTDASAGSNLNLCTSTNTFTAVSGGGAGNPAGSDTYVQYNSSGSFGAEAAFAYNASTNTLSVDKINLTGAASETIMTDISTPSAPSSGKTAVYTKSGQLASRANGGSEVLYAHGNSSGEATKGVAGAYDATSWNGSSETPTKDAVRDQLQLLGMRAISFSFGDPAGSALSSGSTTTSYVTVPFACTISAWNIVVDGGTATVKFWRKATGTAIPTSSDSINTSGVAISTGTAIHSTTVSDFTSTSIAANDILAANISSVATAKFLNVTLGCQQ